MFLNASHQLNSNERRRKFRRAPQSLKKQNGSTIIVAVIISLVLLGLGIGLSNQISSNVRQQSIEFLGAQAYLAAQSGMELAVRSIVISTETRMQDGSGNTLNKKCADVPHIQVSLFGYCTFNLSCAIENDVNEPEVPAGVVDIYQLESIAVCESGQLTTSRSVVVEVRQEN
ncbi:agglutinin biogenesis protein MshP [Alteromonas sp. S167]|uniref:agglutinin biogenesis protein MshP n=1 Tax=Alteromonas sp. S167 TaxID=3117402 RepID=UPI002FE0E4DB